jgi:hypothetical protein
MILCRFGQRIVYPIFLYLFGASANKANGDAILCPGIEDEGHSFVDPICPGDRIPCPKRSGDMVSCPPDFLISGLLFRRQRQNFFKERFVLRKLPHSRKAGQ